MRSLFSANTGVTVRALVSATGVAVMIEGVALVVLATGILAFVGVTGAAVETVVAVVAAVEISLKWLIELWAPPDTERDEGIDVISESPPVPVTVTEGACDARLETELEAAWRMGGRTLSRLLLLPAC